MLTSHQRPTSGSRAWPARRHRIERSSLLVVWMLCLTDGRPAAAKDLVESAGAHRKDIPAWWRNTRALYCPFANSGAGSSLMKYKAGGDLPGRLQDFRDLPRILDEARRLGTNVIYLVDYWQPGYEYKGEYVPYEKCGGETAFRDGIAAVHKLGGRVVVYLEAFIISRRTEFAKKVGPQWAMMDEKGEFYPYYHTGARFYLMYPGDGSGWADHLVRVAREMARKYKIDGVHLDSYGLQWNWRDHNPAHPNGSDPSSFNRGANRLVKRMRAELRKHNPDAVVILEGAEQTQLLDVCDGAQIESLSVLKRKPWWRERRYPIFTSSFELAEMKAILDEGYHLALSPWWFLDHVRGRDERRLKAKTDKRNRFDQLESLNIYNNLLVANRIPGSLPLGTTEEISRSIIEQLNKLGWKGEFTNPAFARSAQNVRALHEKHKKELVRTPAGQIRQWLGQ